jgi:hypothetical protein
VDEDDGVTPVEFVKEGVERGGAEVASGDVAQQDDAVGRTLLSMPCASIMVIAPWLSQVGVGTPPAWKP